MDVPRSPQLPYQNFLFNQMKLCWKWHTAAVLYSGVICIFVAEKTHKTQALNSEKSVRDNF